jgi:hypothetical protein
MVRSEDPVEEDTINGVIPEEPVTDSDADPPTTVAELSIELTPTVFAAFVVYPVAVTVDASDASL